MAATTISRAGVGTDDNGTGTTGTVINAAYIGTAIYDAIDALFTASGGITLNQGAGDGAILMLESSDVAHGITGFAGTQVFCAISKVGANDGGTNILGLTEQSIAVQVQGFATNADTTKTTAGVAPIILYSALKNGTSNQAVSANGNLVAIQNLGTTRFIFDAEGDSHQDVGTAWTNFDAFDDIALLNALTGAVSQVADPLKAQFAGLLAEHRAALVENRIVTINDGTDGDGSIFINWSRFHMLMLGAVRQVARELADVRRLALEGTR